MNPEALQKELRARLSRGEDDRALRLLLEAWAGQRAPGLAAAIAWLSPRTIRRHPPLLEPERWLEIARLADPLSVAALLTAPWSHDRLKLLREKLLLLRAFPPDPRLASFAREVQQHLLRTGRHRAQEPELDQLLAWHGPDHGQPEASAAWWAVAQLVREAAAGASMEERLLDAVFSAPCEDGPRHVYADWLLSAGDPYASLVSGSLRRESETGGLSAPQLAWWCRFLLGNVDPNRVGFWRGFPRTLTLPPGDAPLPTPGWATLESLELQGTPLSWLDLLEGGLLAGLVTLSLKPQRAQDLWVERVLERLPVPGLRTLALPSVAGVIAGGLASRWPALETLRLTWVPGPWWAVPAFDEGFLGKLAARPLIIDVYFDPAGNEDWIGTLARGARGASRSLRRVTGSRDGLSAAWERDGAGALRVLRLSGLDHAQLTSLSALLRSIDKGWVDPILVECLRPPGLALREKLQRAILRSHRAELRFVPLPEGGPLKAPGEP